MKEFECFSTENLLFIVKYIFDLLFKVFISHELGCNEQNTHVTVALTVLMNLMLMSVGYAMQVKCINSKFQIDC